MISKDSKILIITLLAGCAIRLWLFFYFQDRPDFFIDDDSREYLQISENLRLGHGFSWDQALPYQPNSFRTPGYPLFLLGHRVLLGSYRPVLITQIFLSIAIAYFLFLIAQELGKPKIGLWSVALFLTMPFSVMASLRFLTQVPFTFLLMMAIWLWIQFMKTTRPKFLWGTALILPLAALIRPIAFWIYLPFLAALLLKYQGSVGKFVKMALVMIAVFFIGIIPWLWRNEQTFGRFKLSSIGPNFLYFYDAPVVYGFAHRVSSTKARQILEDDIKKYAPAASNQTYLDFTYYDILQKRALHFMTESPTALLVSRLAVTFKFFVRDGIRYWLDDLMGNSQWKNTPSFLFLGPVLLERLILGGLFLGMLWAAYDWFKNKRDNQILFLGFTIIAYFAILTGAMASAGLRYPVEGLFILVSLSGFDSFFRTVCKPLSKS